MLPCAIFPIIVLDTLIVYYCLTYHMFVWCHQAVSERGHRVVKSAIVELGCLGSSAGWESYLLGDTV